MALGMSITAAMLRVRFVVWRGFAFAALIVGVALVFVPAARADFGATNAELSGFSAHPSVLSCGPTSGCLIADDAHRVPEGEDNRVITAVDVLLPAGSFVIDVVLMDVSNGLPTQYTVLSRSATRPSPLDFATTPSRIEGGGVRRLTLERPLSLGTSVPTVGLLIRGFSGSVTFGFHDTRDTVSQRLSNSSAWRGRSGEPGETVIGSPPDDVLNDPDTPELFGKFALMPARFVTGIAGGGADLRITKTSLKPIYIAPRNILEFRLVVKNLGPKAAKKVVVTDVMESPFKPFLRITRIFSPRRVKCSEVKKHPPTVRCRTAKMKKGDKFKVTIRARIVAILAVLSYQNLIRGAPYQYFNDAAANAKRPGDPFDGNNSSSLAFGITARGGPCPSDVIRGTRSGDAFDTAGDANSHTILGLGGADVIVGTKSGDCILGGPGRDALFGEGGSDWIDGGPGNDVIKTTIEDNAIDNGTGDAIWGGPDNDRINAINGSRDVIDCGTGKDRVKADVEDRVAGNCERVLRFS